MLNRFDLPHHETTIRQELLAGVVSFFSISYILFVNPMILGQAGVPEEYSIFATIFISAIGSILMGIMANAPLVMAPGMGENAFFAFTLVAGIGLTWQEGLAAGVVSGFILVLLAFTGVMRRFSQSIPNELKQAITVGIGLFLMGIGLENAGFIVGEGMAWNWIGLAGIVLVALLTAHGVRGGFLYAVLGTTILYWVVHYQSFEAVSYELHHLLSYPELLRAPDYRAFFTIEFGLGVFSLTMLLLFETIGMIEALLSDEERAAKGYTVGAIAGFLSGLLGTSPAIPVAESGAGMQEGGRTGLTAVTAGILFLLSLFITPFLSYIPSEAVGGIILFTGGSMALTLRRINVEKKIQWLPLLLIIVLIPLTGSIVEGMAYGFIAYPLVNGAIKGWKSIHPTLWLISGLFLLTLLSMVFI